MNDLENVKALRPVTSGCVSASLSAAKRGGLKSVYEYALLHGSEI